MRYEIFIGIFVCGILAGVLGYYSGYDDGYNDGYDDGYIRGVENTEHAYEYRKIVAQRMCSTLEPHGKWINDHGIAHCDRDYFVDNKR